MRFVLIAKPRPTSSGAARASCVIVDVDFLRVAFHPFVTMRVLGMARRMLLDERSPEAILGEVMRDPSVRVDRAEIGGRRF